LKFLETLLRKKNISPTFKKSFCESLKYENLKNIVYNFCKKKISLKFITTLKYNYYIYLIFILIVFLKILDV